MRKEKERTHSPIKPQECCDVKSMRDMNVIWFTSSITCCPLDNLFIKVWMTWNNGLGSGVVVFSALQNMANQA